jgi:hypothetical protein
VIHQHHPAQSVLFHHNEPLSQIAVYQVPLLGHNAKGSAYMGGATLNTTSLLHPGTAARVEIADSLAMRCANRAVAYGQCRDVPTMPGSLVWACCSMYLIICVHADPNLIKWRRCALQTCTAPSRSQTQSVLTTSRMATARRARVALSGSCAAGTLRAQVGCPLQVISTPLSSEASSHPGTLALSLSWPLIVNSCSVGQLSSDRLRESKSEAMDSMPSWSWSNMHLNVSRPGKITLTCGYGSCGDRAHTALIISIPPGARPQGCFPS